MKRCRRSRHLFAKAHSWQKKRQLREGCASFIHQLRDINVLLAVRKKSLSGGATVGLSSTVRALPASIRPPPTFACLPASIPVYSLSSPVPAVWRDRPLFGGNDWAWVGLPSVVSGDGYLGAKNSVIPQRQWAWR